VSGPETHRVEQRPKWGHSHREGRAADSPGSIRGPNCRNGRETRRSRRDGVTRRKFEGEAPYDRNLMSLATEETVKRTWTIIGVADVPKSFKWYQSLLCLAEAVPAHDYFGRAVDSDGTVLLCLHKWGAHEHPLLTSPQYATPGNGLLLFFRVDNFDVALPRARALVSRLEEPL
jgi:hypothetical protein